jgi:chemotaxis protein histidine kinase CheA
MKTTKLNKSDDLILKDFINYLNEFVFACEFYLKDVSTITYNLVKYLDFINNKHFLFKDKFVVLFSLIKTLEKNPVFDINILKILLNDLINELNFYLEQDSNLKKNIIPENLFVILLEKTFAIDYSPEFSYYKKKLNFITKNIDYIKSLEKKSDDFVRVDKSIINGFFGIMTELLINKDKLFSISKTVQFNEKLINIAGNISSIANRINNFLSEINYIPVKSIFQRYPLIVKNLAKKLNKKINFVINDNSVVIEKQIADSLGEILIHLVKNSVDHGIELPKERGDFGKDETGKIEINALQSGNYVHIIIKDDGRGLDKKQLIDKAIEKRIFSKEKINSFSEDQIYKLIFYPGFSTSDNINYISGRGVGLDAVKNNVEKIGGNISVATIKNHKTEIIIKIPFKTVIAELLFVSINNNIIALTLDYIDNIIYFKPNSIIYEKNKPIFLNYKSQNIPIWHGHFSSEETNFNSLKCGIVFSYKNKYLFFPVHKIVDQTQSIIKNYNFFGLKDFTKKYIIGYTIFNEQIVSIIEPVFNF